MAFDGSLVWLLIAALLVLAAALNADFTLVALALAALAGAGVAAGTGFGIWVQIAVVAVVAGVMGPLLHRFLRPLLLGSNYGVTGSGGEAGLTTTVEQVGNRTGVRIKHDFFPARSDSGEALVAGQTVVVQRIEGITAIVRTSTDAQSRDP